MSLSNTFIRSNFQTAIAWIFSGWGKGNTAPQMSSPLGFGTKVVATLAEINAGKTLIPATVAGQNIELMDFTAVVSGNFATGTTVEVCYSDGSTEVTLFTIATAALTTGAVILPDTSGVTLAAAYTAVISSGNANAGRYIKVKKNGSAYTGGTNITFIFNYRIV